MDRRLSVASLAVGGVLALPAALYVGVFDGPVAALAVALALSLPFATYAVTADPHPPSLLPPRGVLGGACLLALGVLGLALQFAAVPAGLLVCALAVGPALAYHARYAADGVALSTLLASSVLGVTALALVALVSDAPLAGSAATTAVAGGTVWYLRERRLLVRRTRRVAAAVALLGGASVLVVGVVVVEQAILGLAAGAGLLVVGSVLAVE
ncbi:hypothetical protein [Halomarina rubra]|uniref:Uncharacterized protein n=1 Tax=Halomarina rubra TaxID=2071873 RepID=A0ABD6ATV8_9EURY|nr:hypothetical protein [Halomarina rubra]